MIFVYILICLALRRGSGSPKLFSSGWIRVLQVLQNSEHFGTLLITIFGMAKEKSQWTSIGVRSQMSKSSSPSFLPLSFKLDRRIQ